MRRIVYKYFPDGLPSEISGLTLEEQREIRDKQAKIIEEFMLQRDNELLLLKSERVYKPAVIIKPRVCPLRPPFRL